MGSWQVCLWLYPLENLVHLSLSVRISSRPMMIPRYNDSCHYVLLTSWRDRMIWASDIINLRPSRSSQAAASSSYSQSSFRWPDISFLKWYKQTEVRFESWKSVSVFAECRHLVCLVCLFGCHAHTNGFGADLCTILLVCAVAPSRFNASTLSSLQRESSPRKWLYSSCCAIPSHFSTILTLVVPARLHYASLDTYSDKKARFKAVEPICRTVLCLFQMTLLRPSMVCYPLFVVLLRLDVAIEYNPHKWKVARLFSISLIFGTFSRVCMRNTLSSMLIMFYCYLIKYIRYIYVLI